MMNRKNRAAAAVSGGKNYPDLHGTVTFNAISEGILVTAQITGLPDQNDCCGYGVYGFHIHSGSACTGTEENEFADADGHFNPKGCPHPYHAGDMPPLFGNHGMAYMSFLTDRFTLEEIIGKTVIVHLHPDDFTTQPSGNSGTMIACGVITR